MPLSEKTYTSKTLFPFFDGLIPEGWLLGVVSRNWKIDVKDRFGLLLVACKDGIGNVSIRRNAYELFMLWKTASHRKHEFRLAQKLYPTVFSPQPSFPKLPLMKPHLKPLATESTNKGYTVPGVQRKLSLHLFSEGDTPRLTLVNYPTGYILKPQFRI